MKRTAMTGLLAAALILSWASAVRAQDDWNGAADWHHTIKKWKNVPVPPEEKSKELALVGKALRRGGAVKFVPLYLHHMSWESWTLAGDLASLKSLLADGVLHFVKIEGVRTCTRCRLPGTDIAPFGAEERYYRFEIKKVHWAEPQEAIHALLGAIRDALDEALSLLKSGKFAEANEVYGKLLEARAEDVGNIAAFRKEMVEKAKAELAEKNDMDECTFPEVEKRVDAVRMRHGAIVQIENLDEAAPKGKSLPERVAAVGSALESLRSLEEEQRDQRIILDALRERLFHIVPEGESAFVRAVEEAGKKTMSRPAAVICIDLLVRIGTGEALKGLEIFLRKGGTGSRDHAKAALEILMKKVASDPDKARARSALIALIEEKKLLFDLRLQAAVQLLEIADSSVAGEVIRLTGILNFKKDIPRILVKICDKSHWEALREIHRTGDKFAKHNAMLALGAMGDKTMLPNALEATRHSVWYMREAGAIVLGVIGDRSHLPLLAALAQNEKEPKDVRDAALTAMKRLKRG